MQVLVTFDVMAKSFAKTLSIKTGTQLSEKEQEELVNNLFLVKNLSFLLLENQHSKH